MKKKLGKERKKREKNQSRRRSEPSTRKRKAMGFSHPRVDLKREEA